jgi:transcriptional antiterminator/mannitol/fructose-specific phosphotransferase system IIA component (Ntr-type)
MADIDSRSASILKYLTELSTPVSSDIIARQVGLTPRAVRYRMPKISAWLEEAGAELVNKPRYGIFIRASMQKKNQLHNQVSFSSFYSREERIYLILLKLLSSEEAVIIKQFEVLLSVSRSTIVQDISRAEEWLEDHGLKLLSKQNRGFWVEGDEADFREAILSCVLNGARDIGFQDDLMCFSFADSTAALPSHEFALSIKCLFQPVDFKYFNLLLNTVIDIQLSDRAQFHFILRLAIMLIRLKKRKPIRVIPSGLGDLKQLNEYYWTEFLCRKVAERFQLIINLEEITYITRFLIDAQVIRPLKMISDKSEKIEEFDKELICIIDSFLCQVSRRLHPAMAIDRELRYNLASHLKYFQERADISHLDDNPVIQEIKAEYSKIFTIVEQCIRESKAFTLGMHEDEVGYLTIHIAAALEKLRYNEKNTKTVLIVCNAGMASALLLRSKIQSEFSDISIDSVISYHELLERKNFSGIDLIISTIPLHLRSAPPVLVVNVILKDKDLANLEKVLVVQKNERTALPKVSVIDGPRLSALIDNSLIALKKDAKDWVDAAEIAGTLLFKSNLIERRYIDAMKRVVKEFGPYIVVWPGVAMLHANCAEGVRQPGMSLVTLQNPVEFGHPENDPVDIILALSIPQGYSITLALDQLNRLLTDEKALQRLRLSYHRSTVMMLVKKFSQEVSPEPYDFIPG